jgi:Ala-tRNA(Pro) deacylase
MQATSFYLRGSYRMELVETFSSACSPVRKARKGSSMSLARLQEFLDSHNIKYVVISHSVGYTAQGIAALTHISGKELAKPVIVKLDGALAMVVVPAASQVDLSRLKSVTGATNAVLATEQEFKDKFPDCETGAMPPFGNLYDLPVLADDSLTRDKEIAFNAGSHRELVRMAWDDFEKLVKPRMARFATGGVGTIAA